MRYKEWEIFYIYILNKIKCNERRIRRTIRVNKKQKKKKIIYTLIANRILKLLVTVSDKYSILKLN